MKLEDMVCSLEMSQRLVKAGITVESYFYWMEDILLSSKTHNVNGCVPAPLFCELAELLPDSVGSDRAVYDLLVQKGVRGDWFVWYSNPQDEEFCGFIADGCTPANAAAAMLIWLKENGHLEEI